jgi:hypothetical protein
MLKKKGPVLSLLAVQRSGSRAQRHTPHPYRPSGQERAHCDEHLVPPDVQPLARSPPYVVARRPARPGYGRADSCPVVVSLGLLAESTS